MTSRIATVQHLDNIDEALTLLARDIDVEERSGSRFDLRDIDYLWTAEGELIPSVEASFASPFLYRGQVARHCPCVPGVFRGMTRAVNPRHLPLDQRAKIFADRVRLEEFILALGEHPASQYSREIGLRIHPIAMAQHYGMATDRVDLTQDHLVAAFFATNSLEGGAWRPAKEGLGVVYRLRRSVFAKHVPDDLECVGKQAWPRPGEQKAFTLRLPLGRDLEVLPVEIFTFQQHEARGQRLSDRFNDGASLFPPDILAEVASTIRAAQTLPKQIVGSVLKKYGVPDEVATAALQRTIEVLRSVLGIEVLDRTTTLISSVQHARAQVDLNAMREVFLNRVGVIAVRDSEKPVRTS